MSMRQWAKENGMEAMYDEYLQKMAAIGKEIDEESKLRLARLYDEYLQKAVAIRNELEEECTLRVARLRESYPELFWEEVEEEEES